MKNDLIMSGYFYSGISNCFVLRDAASTLEPCTRAFIYSLNVSFSFLK